MILDTITIKYLGEYPRDFVGIGSFLPDEEKTLEKGATADYLLGLLDGPNDEGIILPLFEEVKQEVSDSITDIKEGQKIANDTEEDQRDHGEQ